MYGGGGGGSREVKMCYYPVRSDLNHTSSLGVWGAEGGYKFYISHSFLLDRETHRDIVQIQITENKHD